MKPRVMISLFLVGEFPDQTDAENHSQQTDSDDDQEHEPEPAQNHSRSADTTFDTAVAHILGDRASSDGSRVLP